MRGPAEKASLARRVPESEPESPTTPKAHIHLQTHVAPTSILQAPLVRGGAAKAETTKPVVRQVTTKPSKGAPHWRNQASKRAMARSTTITSDRVDIGPGREASCPSTNHHFSHNHKEEHTRAQTAKLELSRRSSSSKTTMCTIIANDTPNGVRIKTRERGSERSLGTHHSHVSAWSGGVEQTPHET